MPRVTHVQKAQASKFPRRCATCSHEIQPGEPYKRAKLKTGPRSSRTIVWCKDHSPRASQMTSSQHLSTIYAAQEDFEDMIAQATTADEIRDALEQTADAIREAAESYRESAENIESGFGHATSMSDELNEKADNVESWCDDISSAADSLDEFDESEARETAEAEVFNDLCAEHEDALQKLEDDAESEIEVSAIEDWEGLADVLGLDHEKIEVRINELVEDALSEWADNAREEVASIVQDMPF